MSRARIKSDHVTQGKSDASLETSLGRGGIVDIG